MSDDGDLLEASFASAFATPPPATTTTEAVPVSEAGGPGTTSTESGTSGSSSSEPSQPAADVEPRQDSDTDARTAAWKKEYERQVSQWHKESEVQRTKAEQTRARWEEQRAIEKSQLHLSSIRDGFEILDNDNEASMSIPGPPTLDTPPPPATRAGLGDRDDHKVNEQQSGRSSPRKWEEEVHSLESSYPSLSYPDQDHRSRSESPLDTREKKPREEQTPTVPSVSLSIFNSSLTTRTRVLALVSSLAINLFLPFVNGVMLGVGEIFAKSIMERWGWRIPGGAATAVGLAATRRAGSK